MSLASATLSPDGLVREPDWTTLGLILSIVGSFLLANAILFRNPRSLVREHYGVRRGELRTIREFIFHRLQMTLGFAFLLSGFALELVGRLRPAAPAGREFPILWIGVIVLSAVVLELVGWWWSLRQFRRYVREYLLENPPDFATDVATVREVGELFGIVSAADETVPSYVARVRRAIGLAPAPSGPPGGEEPLGLPLAKDALEPAFEEEI